MERQQLHVQLEGFAPVLGVALGSSGLQLLPLREMDSGRFMARSGDAEWGHALAEWRSALAVAARAGFFASHPSLRALLFRAPPPSSPSASASSAASSSESAGSRGGAEESADAVMESAQRELATTRFAALAALLGFFGYVFTLNPLDEAQVCMCHFPIPIPGTQS